MLVINVIMRYISIKSEYNNKQQQVGDLLLAWLASLPSFDGEFAWRVKLIMKN